MNGNSSIKVEGVHVGDLPTYKKPKMQNVVVTIIVEDEFGHKEVHAEQGEWIAKISLKEILELIKEAIEKIE